MDHDTGTMPKGTEDMPVMRSASEMKDLESCRVVAAEGTLLRAGSTYSL